jgi:DTW domain-containing protein YfiP
MGRSVVHNQTPRCERCQQQLRWCICDGFRAIDCPVKVDVLMHHMETYRPSSTGHLIQRVIPTAGQHIYRRERPLDRSMIVRPGKTLWILHPSGEPMPVGVRPSDLQVLLLDGNWPQTSEMIRLVEGWGRKINLPMAGTSRYWLRAQHGEGKFSTVEALLFLLDALGLKREADQLRVQFELHVYAGLCSRGNKPEAAEYLATSPLRDAVPDVLRQLAPRARPATGGDSIPAKNKV